MMLDQSNKKGNIRSWIRVTIVEMDILLMSYCIAQSLLKFQ